MIWNPPAPSGTYAATVRVDRSSGAVSVVVRPVTNLSIAVPCTSLGGAASTAASMPGGASAVLPVWMPPMPRIALQAESAESAHTEATARNRLIAAHDTTRARLAEHAHVDVALAGGAADPRGEEHPGRRRRDHARRVAVDR